MSDTEESVCDFHYSDDEDDAFEAVPPPAKRGRLDEDGHVASAASSPAADRSNNRLLAFDEVGSRKGQTITQDGYSWTVLAETQLGAMMTHTVDGAYNVGCCVRGCGRVSWFRVARPPMWSPDLLWLASVCRHRQPLCPAVRRGRPIAVGSLVRLEGGEAGAGAPRRRGGQRACCCPDPGPDCTSASCASD